MDCKAIFLLCIAIMPPWMTGCNLLPNHRSAQFEAESERLLAEFKVERDRADRMDVLNRTLTARVAQLEKRLASTAPVESNATLADRTDRPGTSQVPAARPYGAPPTLTPTPSSTDPWQPAARR